MDKTTKFLLGLIAVGLIAINIQLYDNSRNVTAPGIVYMIHAKLGAIDKTLSAISAIAENPVVKVKNDNTGDLFGRDALKVKVMNFPY